MDKGTAATAGSACEFSCALGHAATLAVSQWALLRSTSADWEGLGGKHAGRDAWTSTRRAVDTAHSLPFHCRVEDELGAWAQHTALGARDARRRFPRVAETGRASAPKFVEGAEEESVAAVSWLARRCVRIFFLLTFNANRTISMPRTRWILHISVTSALARRARAFAPLAARLPWLHA
ncbi:hypothetical protein MSAN_02351100 [Mycena sanguinolenta]|uniref:Uncharacterized protein n=1 Tax=Mycena sanguinolenta TaxID=230812 RepID=A0A8H6X613_9AGAR|nr:hypothetical protein MSAN_02351100 [Mycena sanguinolenta]